MDSAGCGWNSGTGPTTLNCIFVATKIVDFHYTKIITLFERTLGTIQISIIYIIYRIIIFIIIAL